MASPEHTRISGPWPRTTRRDGGASPFGGLSAPARGTESGGKHISGRFLVSLLTKSQASRFKARAKARAGAARAKARRRARRAVGQAGPLQASARASARATARNGIRHARTWAAPRIERTGHTLEERVAPRMAGMLSAAARRIEPIPPPRHRRWPMLAAGLVTAAGLSATAAYLLRRRGSADTATGHTKPATGDTMATPATPVAPSEVNGRVRTG